MLLSPQWPQRLCALAFVVLRWQASFAESPEICPVEPPSVSGTSLISLGFRLWRGKGQQESCAVMTNHGTHVTVPIDVGTPVQGKPRQRLNVVADTGSNALIVLSCACHELGTCDAGETCFRGTNLSTTFQTMRQGPDNQVVTFGMSFGSGTILTVVATDTVNVGGLEANMSHGLLLMVDKRLSFNFALEGILGLGVPGSQKLFDVIGSETAPGATVEPTNGDAQTKRATPQISPPPFLQQAAVSRFSVCLDSDGKIGAFRLNSPRRAEPALGSVGKLHWGIGMNGISVGSTAAPVTLCSPKTMSKLQKTPCGAIPDSGTTLMMGPQKHISALLESICDSWPRCSKLAQPNAPKSQTLLDLLYTCADWMDPSAGLSELPELHFSVTGQGRGESQVLTLDGNTYVAEVNETEYKYVTKYLLGFIPYKTPIPAGQRQVCTPAFGAVEMHTVENGDVWLFGMPLFYKFQVHYDLKPTSGRPSITFINEPCGSCEKGMSLLSEDAQAVAPRRARSRPIEIRGAPRVPDVDKFARDHL